jgi:competence protein ComEC
MNMKSHTLIIAILLIVSDVFVWHAVGFGAPRYIHEIDILDVGQGDASLIRLPGGITILTDAGPDASVTREIESVLPRGERYIDLGIITHPQLDHFGGYNALIGRYRFGAILFNGITDSPYAPKEWKLLQEKIASERIPLIKVGAGDRVRVASDTLHIISPDASLMQSAELNDTGIVSRLTTPLFKALFTADIGFAVEDFMAKQFDISADILKIGHHGSKTSSGGTFLTEVNPKVATVSAGETNRHGHPAPATLARIVSSTHATIFRTDQRGTIRIVVDGDTLRVFTER